jgi:hypothetical protein
MDEKNKNKKGFSKEQLARIGFSGATGGLGNAAKKAANIKYADSISKKAGSLANRINKNKVNKKNKKEEPPKKKMTGPPFWILLIIILIDEIIDMVFNLTGILAILTIFTSLFITFMVITYYIIEGVSLSTRKLVLWIISLTIETIPIINMLPGYSVGFILTRVFENNEKLKKVTNLARGKISKSKK